MLNFSNATKENSDNFNIIISKLEQKGYNISESRLESKGICILFEKVYTFYDTPMGFEIIDTIVSSCEECYYGRLCSGTPCYEYTDPVTILVHKAEKPFETQSELKEILETLTAWESKVPDISAKARIGHVTKSAGDDFNIF